jgi:hypothetical protein
VHHALRSAINAPYSIQSEPLAARVGDVWTTSIFFVRDAGWIFVFSSGVVANNPTGYLLYSCGSFGSDDRPVKLSCTDLMGQKDLNCGRISSQTAGDRESVGAGLTLSLMACIVLYKSVLFGV